MDVLWWKQTWDCGLVFLGKANWHGNYLHMITNSYSMNISIKLHTYFYITPMNLLITQTEHSYCYRNIIAVQMNIKMGYWCLGKFNMLLPSEKWTWFYKFDIIQPLHQPPRGDNCNKIRQHVVQFFNSDPEESVYDTMVQQASVQSLHPDLGKHDCDFASES